MASLYVNNYVVIFSVISIINVTILLKSTLIEKTAESIPAMLIMCFTQGYNTNFDIAEG